MQYAVIRDDANNVAAEASSASVSNYSYSPYGDSAAYNATTTAPGFAGRQVVASNGLYYNRARFYLPQIGRFIGQDPIGLAGGINMYGYVSGNPITFSDPSGESPAGMVVGLVLGGAYNVLANAGTIGEPGAPSVATLFIAGEVGGVVGGAIDNPAVAAGVSGALTAGITAYATTGSITTAAEAAGVSGLINAVAGGIAGRGLGQLGANEVTQFVGGFAAGVWGADIVNAVVPGANAATPATSCH